MLDLSLYTDCPDRKQVVSRLEGGDAEVEFYVSSAENKAPGIRPMTTMNMNLAVVREETEDEHAFERTSVESRTTMMK